MAPDHAFPVQMHQAGAFGDPRSGCCASAGQSFLKDPGVSSRGRAQAGCLNRHIATGILDFVGGFGLEGVGGRRSFVVPISGRVLLNG